MYRIMKETIRTSKLLDGVTVTCPDVTRFSIVDMTDGTPKHVSYVGIRPEQMDELDEAVQKVTSPSKTGWAVWTVGNTRDEDIKVADDISLRLAQMVAKVVRVSGRIAVAYGTDESALWVRDAMREGTECPEVGARRYKCIE